ncbi:hypothetical protein H8356DRAFT_1429693 [Neocallimastix lanati (nom. inval.)]|nr:hypothetical protein H8356DRAFT_1429693 [Neocallimastix sp. JGI-2020a]
MINCHTGTAKETPYRSTLRDPRGKAEPTIGAGHCKSSQTRLTQWDSNSVRNIENLERKNREDMILVGVDPETFEILCGLALRVLTTKIKIGKENYTEIADVETIKQSIP